MSVWEKFTDSLKNVFKFTCYDVSVTYVPVCANLLTNNLTLTFSKSVPSFS